MGKFIIDNLELIVAISGGISVGLIMLIKNSSSNENDLTPLYIKYKRYNDNINKSTKSIF